jgi:hypothetical protein
MAPTTPILALAHQGFGDVRNPHESPSSCRSATVMYRNDSRRDLRDIVIVETEFY